MYLLISVFFFFPIYHRPSLFFKINKNELQERQNKNGIEIYIKPKRKLRSFVLVSVLVSAI